MLVISYGIPKSGSTLSFELIKGMLISAGHAQTRLADGLVSPGHNVNFLEKIDINTVPRVLEAVPQDRFVCIKTHTRIGRGVFKQLETLQAQRRVQVVASYRDPRDICLSLMDAGARAREKGLKAFSECTDLASVIPKVERQIATFRIWASVKGALRLPYELVAFDPDKAIDALEQALGIKCDRAAAKKHAYEDAFTQKNKGVAKRHLTDLTEAQRGELEQKFDRFLRRVLKRNDETWFTDFREKFLTQPAAANA